MHTGTDPFVFIISISEVQVKLNHSCLLKFVVEEAVHIAGALVVEASGIVLQALEGIGGVEHVNGLLPATVVVVHQVSGQLHADVFLHQLFLFASQCHVLESFKLLQCAFSAEEILEGDALGILQLLYQTRE